MLNPIFLIDNAVFYLETLCMKKIILILGVIIASCSKPKNDTLITNQSFCWSCEVSRWTDGVQFHVDTCTKNNYAPQFKDDNGNDENAICQHK